MGKLSKCCGAGVMGSVCSKCGKLCEVNEIKEEEILLKWQRISEATYRLKVFGGWIVESCNTYSDKAWGSSVFVPDINHKWKIQHD